MPKGIPKKGYRRTKKLDTPSLQEVEKRLALRVPELIKELEELCKTHYCPSCNTPIVTADREAIIYLIDRAMGKPVQKQTLDITQTIQLSADQIDKLIMNHPILAKCYEIAQRELLAPVIEAEVKEIGG